MREASHAVLLSGQRVGDLLQRGDVARFVFSDDYWSSVDRNVLGLWFEDDPRRSPQAALRLPPWFSNLLPEGQLREWIGRDQGISADRELQLLLRIGRDLPGAVEVVPGIDVAVDPAMLDNALDSPATGSVEPSQWKFSLAGVGLKFSMLRAGDRLVIPGYNTLGDWIVKFPTEKFAEVPANEHGMMKLAANVGIDVPAVELIDRDALPNLPDVLWPRGERLAYAVQRFDRSPGGKRVHIEDFAQVRGWYAERKYDGTFETVAALSFRGRDLESLHEFVRRLVFNILVGNGDAHLKNWSLIYPDGRIPRLSPAYDLVSTGPYYSSQQPDTVGLRFGKTRVFDRITRSSFVRLQQKLGVDDADVLDVVDATLNSFSSAWEERVVMPSFVSDWIGRHARSVRGRLSVS